MKHPLVKEILYTRTEIAQRSQELALEIDQHYQSQDVVENTILIVGILKGCVPFMAEILNHITYECETDYMVMSSYKGGVKASGDPKIVLDINTNVKNRHILIAEDVIDSGLTLEFVKNYFYTRGAKDVKIITLVDKPTKRAVDLVPDWTGFKVGDEFLIGFGLDYEERLRNLPYVATCDIAKLKDWKW
ncbi:hypoxanthine phosphoribosyltransferase [Williamsoniiplasma lucivorax]|uniref:Hypoxanthine phosphoribosyltransferase n=1 Tax=Williamsoniiplasma lucivorax TaxID=209274 RepID=A0A2S5RB07_9MOLU|nr:hypoxanthine phosphoribosyltransferase [Williamsoniiplasma lucivorax]PPE04315.1 hypoxanthine-guanine phosphoribosyltransferase [Williamsoniiplasma lucivorax]